MTTMRATERGSSQYRDAHDEAWDVTCVVFGAEVVLTVPLPLTVLLVLAANGLGGHTAAYALIGILVALAPLTYGVTYARVRHLY